MNKKNIIFSIDFEKKRMELFKINFIRIIEAIYIFLYISNFFYLFIN
jgi:hypothetical protein